MFSLLPLGIFQQMNPIIEFRPMLIVGGHGDWE